MAASYECPDPAKIAEQPNVRRQTDHAGASVGVGIFLAILTLYKVTWGRCYDHNFLRFLPIFGEKIGVFLKNQCYDLIFRNCKSSLGKKRQYFRQIF
jgi:hypothetical protein